MSVQEVLGIFRQKTAPAFEVALRLGAAFAKAGKNVHEVLTRYSAALGTAYQIRDDLDDLASEEAALTLKPTLPLAEALDRARGADRTFLEETWSTADVTPEDARRVRALIESLRVEERCRQLLESYKEEAIRAQDQLDAGPGHGRR